MNNNLKLIRKLFDILLSDNIDFTNDLSSFSINGIQIDLFDTEKTFPFLINNIEWFDKITKCISNKDFRIEVEYITNYPVINIYNTLNRSRIFVYGIVDVDLIKTAVDILLSKESIDEMKYITITPNREFIIIQYISKNSKSIKIVNRYRYIPGRLFLINSMVLNNISKYIRNNYTLMDVKYRNIIPFTDYYMEFIDNNIFDSEYFDGSVMNFILKLTKFSNRLTDFQINVIRRKIFKVTILGHDDTILYIDLDKHVFDEIYPLLDDASIINAIGDDIIIVKFGDTYVKIEKISNDVKIRKRIDGFIVNMMDPDRKSILIINKDILYICYDNDCYKFRFKNTLIQYILSVDLLEVVKDKLYIYGSILEIDGTNIYAKTFIDDIIHVINFAMFYKKPFIINRYYKGN